MVLTHDINRLFSTGHVVGFAAAVYNLTMSNAEVVGKAVALLTVPPSVTIAIIFGALVHFIAQVSEDSKSTNGLTQFESVYMHGV